MKPETLAVLTGYSLALTRLRQNECKHLCIENFGPDILYQVLLAYRSAVEDKVEISTTAFRETAVQENER